jgi:WD40 repeat protein
VVALPDGTTIVSVSVDGTLATWDLPSTSLKKTLRIDPAGVGPMAVSPDGRAIVVAGRNGIVQCLESQLAKSRWRVRLGDANIGSLTFSPDSQTLAVVGSLCIQSSRLWLLDPTCGHVRRTIDIPAWLCRLAYSPDGKTLVHAFDGRLRLWDLETEQYYQIISAVHWPSVLVFSPDGRFLAVGGESGWVKLLDWPNGRSIAEIGLPRDSVAAIAITPDGRRLIGATSYHDEITVWRREDEPMPLKGHRNAVRSLAVTPDGRQLISASADGSLIVWDLETGRLESTMMILPTPSAAGSPAEWISYTPAGQRLGSADADRFVIER